MSNPVARRRVAGVRAHPHLPGDGCARIGRAGLDNQPAGGLDGAALDIQSCTGRVRPDADIAGA